ncbi:MAG: sulfite exporter TauE/SafE family protein [Leptospiraceae bacterium]|nr:sulfite exporter TauE/SafE family protein [Leptospiraceae bacterium]MDW7975154.1 sulfite exporter TauE/SafE family protein [Leptospiraceae bacterium]
MTSFYLIALSTGFFGGFAHCVSMCGPVVSSVILGKSPYLSFWQNTLIQILYHFGRIFTYSLIGLVMGFTGSFVNTMGSLMGIKNAVLILVSIFMIFKGLEHLHWLPSSKLYLFLQKLETLGYHFSGWVRNLKESSSIWSYFLIGMVLGLLPCGLSYTAFITSSGLGDPMKGFLFMFLFGLANIPSLWVVVSFSSVLFMKFRNIMNILTGIMFLLFGGYYLYSSLSKIFQ